MLIFYDPDTLTPQHVVHQANHTFLDYQKAHNPNWVETGEKIPHGKLGLRRGTDGNVVAYQLTEFNISAPASMTVGQETPFANVPGGTMISVNGASLARMDGSGELDFIPMVAGNYTFKFEGVSYIPWEVTIEANP